MVDPDAPPAPIPGWDGRVLDAEPAKLAFPEGNALRYLHEPDQPEIPIKCLDCDEMVREPTTPTFTVFWHPFAYRCGLEMEITWVLHTA